MLRGLRIIAENKIGVLRDLTTIIAEEGGNITFAQTFLIKHGEYKGKALIYFEIEGGDFEKILERVRLLTTYRKLRRRSRLRGFSGRG